MNSNKIAMLKCFLEEQLSSTVNALSLFETGDKENRNFINGVFVFPQAKDTQTTKKAHQPTEEDMPKIYQRQNGTYEIRFTFNKKRISIYGKTKADVRKKFKDIQANGFRTLKIGQKNTMLMAEWFEKWLTLFKMNEVSTGTLMNYRSIIKNHFNSLVGTPINKINSIAIQETLNNITATRQRQVAYDILSNAFGYAFRNEIIKKNPMLLLSKPKHTKQQKKVISVEQEARLYEVCDNAFYSQFVKFCILTGCRKTEALSILKSDVDLKNETLKIVTLKQKKPTSRDFPIFQELNSLLSEILSISKTEYLFDFTPDYAGRKFNELCKICDFTGLSLHSTRHTFTTRAFERGLTPKVVQYLLGHATSQMTMDIYAHVSSKMIGDAKKLLD